MEEKSKKKTAVVVETDKDKKDGAEKFHVKVKSDDPTKTTYRETEGEKVELGHDCTAGMVHENADGSFTVSDKRTGLALSGKQGTKKEAVAHAKQRLEHYKDTVKDNLAKHPNSPSHTGKKGKESSNKKKPEKDTKKDVKKSQDLDWGFLD